MDKEKAKQISNQVNEVNRLEMAKERIDILIKLWEENNIELTGLTIIVQPKDRFTRQYFNSSIDLYYACNFTLMQMLKAQRDYLEKELEDANRKLQEL